VGAQARASWWESAGKLSHPHLLQILDTGRWHPDDEQEIQFAVMEYADENLAEILPNRRLTPDEAIAMLLPTLDVLDYLHGHGMVHGDIKPANIMAAGDELKLSSDGIRPVGNSEAPVESRSMYAAPERVKGAILPSGDIWSLGTVLVEALTNRLPTRDKTDEQDPKLPEDIPQPFGDIAAHCLNSDSGRRWSTAEIRECLDRAQTEAKQDLTTQQMSPVTEGQGAAHAPAVAITAPLPRDTKTIVGSHWKTREQRAFRLAVAIIVALVLIAAGVRMFHHSTETRQPVSTTSVHQGTESSLQPLTTDVSKSTTDNVDHGAVSHQVLPDVPSKARNTITGKVKVTVKVAVDASGAVSHASLVSRGPSEYFANQALQAARKWTFKPPTVHGRAVPSEWSLSFEFKSNGTTAAAQRTSPDP